MTTQAAGGNAPAPPTELWHDMGGKSIREVIFGLNDGLVTAFGFVSGVSGAHLRPLLIFLTGLAQAVAGALSMFFGAYLSTKAQTEFFQSEIEREKMEIETMPERETEEVREIYRARGFTPDETEMIVKRITSNKNEWLWFMMREELGLFPQNFDKPLKVALIIGCSFFLAALIPVFPYSLFSGDWEAFWSSTLLSLVFLFAVGGLKTRVTRTSWLSSGLEMLVVGLIAGGIGFGVGKLLAYWGLGGVAL